MIANAGFIAAGALGGLVYFGSLWWNITLYLGGQRIGAAAALHVLRLGALAALLALTATRGALPLLLTALGLLIARPLMMRWMAAAP
jgi:F1F0 ATPase subunit 2